MHWIPGVNEAKFHSSDFKVLIISLWTTDVSLNFTVVFFSVMNKNHITYLHDIHSQVVNFAEEFEVMFQVQHLKE